MKSGDRSLRRHHVERLKKSRGDPKASDKEVGRRVHTAARCSCHMCGNPRKYYDDETMQERRQGLAANEYE